MLLLLSSHYILSTQRFFVSLRLCSSHLFLSASTYFVVRVLSARVIKKNILRSIVYKGASRRAALAARRFARRLHAMSSAVVVFAFLTWKRELFSMTVEKRLKTGSWRVVRSLIQLLMVMENRPVVPGSIQRSHRPISFIKIKHRTCAVDISFKTEY